MNLHLRPHWSDERPTILARRSRSGSARGGFRNPEADRRRGSGDIGPPPPRSGAEAFGPTNQPALNHERRRRAASAGLGREGTNHFALHHVRGRRRRFGPRDLCIGTCGRYTAPGYTVGHCCLTCRRSGGARHGSTCRGLAEQGVHAWALPSAPRHYEDDQGVRRRYGFGRGGDGKTSGAPPSAQVNPMEIAPGYEAHPWGTGWSRRRARPFRLSWPHG